MVATYCTKFAPDMGAGATNPRWVIGAFIIKHKLGFSDEETLQSISENAYMQFFLGLDTYRPAPLFSPTLFVNLRKTLGEETFGAFSELLITLTEAAESPARGPEAAAKGKLKIDATVADQYIRYPTDLSLVNEARVKTEAIIDRLWELLGDQLPVKPRTYRKLAHKRYLRQAKKKKSTAADRGKAGTPVEFGSKLGLSLFGGYLTHQRISWDAYN